MVSDLLMNMMAIPLENFSQKHLDQDPVHSVFPFSVDCTMWRNSNEKKMTMALSDNISLKLETPPKPHHKQLGVGLQLPDQESSTAHSIGQSLHRVCAMEVQNAQEQCISSESGTCMLRFLGLFTSHSTFVRLVVVWLTPTQITISSNYLNYSNLFYSVSTVAKGY